MTETIGRPIIVSGTVIETRQIKTLMSEYPSHDPVNEIIISSLSKLKDSEKHNRLLEDKNCRKTAHHKYGDYHRYVVPDTDRIEELIFRVGIPDSKYSIRSYRNRVLDSIGGRASVRTNKGDYAFHRNGKLHSDRNDTPAIFLHTLVGRTIVTSFAVIMFVISDYEEYWEDGRFKFNRGNKNTIVVCPTHKFGKKDRFSIQHHEIFETLSFLHNPIDLSKPNIFGSGMDEMCFIDEMRVLTSLR